MNVRLAAALIILFAGAYAANAGPETPDRDSLVGAWEAHIAALPSTVAFEPLGDGVYRLEDSDLPYDGELKIVGALVRSADTGGYSTGFSHLGMVDFELTDIPVERLSSQVYYFWLGDRQTMHFSDSEQRWVDIATYQASISGMYSAGASYGALSFMLNYGIWIILIAVVIVGIIAVGKQAKKARTLMDDSAAINDMARQNIERAEGLRDEILAIARETRDLQADNNKLLRQMLDTLRQ